MAYIKIETKADGKLVAKIQISGKDPKTGKPKVFTKRLPNDSNLTEAKFRRHAEKVAFEYEQEVDENYKMGRSQLSGYVPTFKAFAEEWLAGVRQNLSINYVSHSENTINLFQAFLEEKMLADSPMDEIKTRDAQAFFNSFHLKENGEKTCKLKCPFPERVNLRELDRLHIIGRSQSYYLVNKEGNITTDVARAICSHCDLDFERYFELNEKKPYSIATIRGHRQVLRAIFNEAIRLEWITANPIKNTKLGGGDSNSKLEPLKEKEVFTSEEAEMFMRRLNSEPPEVIYKVMTLKFMLLTGVRVSEMCGIRWSDIDYDKKRVHIQRNRLYDSKVGVYEKAPKTKTSIRYIPLPDGLIDDLKRYENWFRIADRFFDSKRDNYYVASNLYRQPLTSQSISSWLKTYLRRWGMKEVSCHGLRHTYCTLLLTRNVPIQTVSRYMGHADSTITLKVYSHFLPETVEQVFFALDRFIEQTEVED